jgi:hypothetical protein
MSDIGTGQYIIIYYTKKGAKLRDLTEYPENLQAAKEIGDESVACTNGVWDEVASYTVDRRLHNSLD